jgi:hypothetical protein
MPGLPTILKHLFTDSEDNVKSMSKKKNKDEDLEAVNPADVPEALVAEDEKKPAEAAEVPKEDAAEDALAAETTKKESSLPAEGKASDVKQELTEDDAKGEGDDTKDDIKSEAVDGENGEKGETSEENAEEEEEVPETPRRVKMPYAGSDDPDPESRYLTLTLAQKLEILTFLCNHSMMSKVVRNYVDDCETRLTEDRKEKADINKERRELYVSE